MRHILNYLLYSFIIVFFTACGGGGGTTLTSITSFEASATTIVKGSSVNLTAVFTNGTASINKGVGAVSSNTAKTVKPTATTTYTLRVTNSLGASITSSVKVTVLTTYNIFPPGFFDDAYNNGTFRFTGSDTDLSTHTATLLEESGDDTDFNNIPVVKTIKETLLITNVDGGGGATGQLSNQYWTIDVNNRKYVGYEIPENGAYATKTSNSVMPITADIGDSGTMGSYERSDGSTFSITWQLVTGSGVNAKYITTTVSKVADSLDYTATVTSTINQVGKILGQKIVIIYHNDSDRTLTLTSPLLP